MIEVKIVKKNKSANRIEDCKYKIYLINFIQKLNIKYARSWDNLKEFI